MKNAFIVSAALLLIGTLGGGYTAYRVGTHHEEKAAEGSAASSEMGSAGEAAGTSAPPTAQPEGAVPGNSSAASADNSSTDESNVDEGGNQDNALSAGSMQPSGASQSPNAAGNTPGDNQPAGNASATEGATVVARDRASGESPTSQVAQPTSADNPSGSAPAPGSSSAATPSSGGAGGDIKAGKALFGGAKKPEVNCAVCHGAGGKGGVGANLTTADGPKTWTDAQFVLSLRQGQAPDRMLNATMPRFGETQLSDAEILDIHAFVKSLR